MMQTVVAGALAMGLLSGCGGSGTSDSSVPRELGGPGVSRPISGGRSQGDARCTILLAQYNGPDRVQLAQELMARAKQVLETDDIWLEQVDGGIAVNYGRFKESTPGSEAQREMERVKRLYGRLETGAYQFAYVKELPEPDPPAPAQWELLRSNCAYSLEVATYFNVPERGFHERKRSAVEAVRNLREKGEEAYFVHGRRQSRVYVGCFGPGAVRRGPQGQMELSPLVDALRRKYPYHENGQVLYRVAPILEGGSQRIRQPAMLMPLEMLRQNMPY
jgi:hypothetical protein